MKDERTKDTALNQDGKSTDLNIKDIRRKSDNMTSFRILIQAISSFMCLVIAALLWQFCCQSQQPTKTVSSCRTHVIKY